MAAETKIVVSQIPPYDGEYEIDFEQSFSAREWRWIKKLSDGEFRAGSMAAEDLDDPDFVIALTVIAMRREGKITQDEVLDVADKLSDAPMNSSHILVVFPEMEEESLPPELTSEPNESSKNNSLENENSPKHNNNTDGNGSRNGSDLSDETQERTGLTRLATSSASAPTTSAT